MSTVRGGSEETWKLTPSPNVIHSFNLLSVHYTCYNVYMQNKAVDNEVREIALNIENADRYAQSAIKNLTETIDEIRKEYQDILNLGYTHLSPGEFMQLEQNIKDELQEKTGGIENRINFLKEIIDYKKMLSKCDIIVNVEEAKKVPVTDLLDFNTRGKAICIWHNDTNPSLHLYKEQNRVWCFSCNQGGDSIEIVKQKYNLDFISAVKFLTHGQ